MDKTFAEVNGCAAFDWRLALNKAIKKEPTAGQIFRMEELAQGWVSCATGNQCAIIPRNSDGCPFDNELMKLGGWFYGGICACDWKWALQILDQIEARAVVLIQAELAKRNGGEA